jgi:hypothetical protein
MVCKGTVRGSSIDLEEPIPLAEGTRVDVTVIPLGQLARNSPRAWMRVVGTLTGDEADAMLDVVRQECRGIDPELWHQSGR